MPDNLKFITNQKGKQALLHNSHRYNFAKNNKNGSLWRCVNKGECSASVTLNDTKDKIVRKSSHCCAPHPDDNKRALMMDLCRQEVCSKMEPVKKIFERHVLIQSSIKGSENLIMPSYSEVKDNLYRARKKTLNVKRTEFKKIQEVVIPKIMASDFLVADDGGDDKILLFCSKIAKKTLKVLRNQYFFGDGTFKRCPKPFFQFFSIHVDLNSSSEYTNILPVIYALLPNKTEVTYIRLFTLIRDVLNIDIRNFKCDYEAGLMNAFKAVFPRAVVTGCFYHYNRAVWKKGRELKVKNEIIRHTANLPLLPIKYIDAGWRAIMNRAPKTARNDKFIKYFKRQWEKSFSLICCATERHRTNNGMESWHRRLNVRIPHKATLLLFLYILRKEARLKDIAIKQHYFNKSRRLRRHIQFDKMLKNEITSLKHGHINEMQFLENIFEIKKQILHQNH